jgi:hypothetical protein
MNDTYIVTGFVIIDDLLILMNYKDDSRTKVRASEIMIMAVVAAKYFQNRQHAFAGKGLVGPLPGSLSLHIQTKSPPQGGWVEPVISSLG